MIAYIYKYQEYYIGINTSIDLFEFEDYNLENAGLEERIAHIICSILKK